MISLIRVILFLFVTISPLLLSAQCGSITLSSQSDVDNFFSNYPGCDTISSLKIKGNDIVSLQGLNGIKYVGTLTILSNPLLPDLHGLETLQHIDLDCSIVGNASLLSTNGLQNATGINGWLSIDNNAMLTDLSGLAGMEKAELVAITRNAQLITLSGMENFKQAIPAGSSNLFTIENNPRLVNLQGLNGLEGGFYLQIDMNDSLVSLAGLDHLIYAQGITLHHNPLLSDLKGLHNMTGCKEYISIQFDSSLTTLEGLEKITETNLSLISNKQLVSLKGLDNVHLLWAFEVSYNPSLVSIMALSNVTYIKSCSISHNPLLNLCSLPYFCELSLPFPSKYSISNNGGGCTQGNIIFGCNQAVSTVEGRIFIDLNCNQSFDVVDMGTPYHLIDIGTLPHHWSNTNPLGFYFNYLPPNKTTTISPVPFSHFTSIPSNHQVTTGSQYQGFDGINFAFCPDTLFHDIAVHQSHFQTYRPGFTTKAQVCVENIGVFAEHALLNFEIKDTPASAYVTIVDASGGGIINGKTITWDLTLNNLFTPACFTITMQVDPQAPLYELITTSLSAQADNTIVEIDDENNVDQYSEQIRSSYDPNEKVVDQDRVAVSSDGHALAYTIRFQNTGNFPATFIEVLDTLESNLEVSTFRMIDASHAYQLSFPDSNIVRWRFDDIQLSDSLTDEAGSHGFIHYSISSKSNLPAQSTIANRASIYFDYNTPVITKDAITQVLYPDRVKEAEDSTLGIKLFPNPVKKEEGVFFEIRNPVKVRMELVSLDGVVWHQQDYSYSEAGDHLEKISLQGMPTGIYLIHFISGQRHEVQKLVVQE